MSRVICHAQSLLSSSHKTMERGPAGMDAGRTAKSWGSRHSELWWDQQGVLVRTNVLHGKAPTWHASQSSNQWASASCPSALLTHATVQLRRESSLLVGGFQAMAHWKARKTAHQHSHNPIILITFGFNPPRPLQQTPNKPFSTQ